MKNLILLLVFAGTVALAYFYGAPAWKSFSESRVKLAEVESLKQKVSEIAEARNKLLDRYTSVRQEELDRLDVLLPTVVAPEELYVFFEKIIQDSGVAADDITIAAPTKGGGESAETRLPFIIKITGPYANIRALFDNMENNLRLMDVDSIGIGSVESGGAIFSITIKGNMYYGG